MQLAAEPGTITATGVTVDQLIKLDYTLIKASFEYRADRQDRLCWLDHNISVTGWLEHNHHGTRSPYATDTSVKCHIP